MDNLEFGSMDNLEFGNIKLLIECAAVAFPFLGKFSAFPEN